jgi:hypothetical protein
VLSPFLLVVDFRCETDFLLFLVEVGCFWEGLTILLLMSILGLTMEPRERVGDRGFPLYEEVLLLG